MVNFEIPNCMEMWRASVFAYSLISIAFALFPGICFLKLFFPLSFFKKFPLVKKNCPEILQKALVIQIF